MRKYVWTLILAGGFFGVVTARAGEGQVQRLVLKPGKDRTTLLITHSGEGKFRLFKSEMQGNVIIEAENLVVPPALTKMIDASASNGPVLQLTPYNSQHSGQAMAKVVLQLRGRADVTSSKAPGQFVVEIVRKAGALPPSPEATAMQAKDEVKARLSALRKSEEVAHRLIEVLSAPPEEKKYFGSRVTFEAKDAEVPDIFRLVGESSDLNIIWDKEVEGQTTSLSVKDLPWDQLLDIVVQQKSYKATVMGNVVRIMLLDTFNKQNEAKKKEMTLSDELEPVIMAVIPLSFSTASDMKKLISDLIQEKNLPASKVVGTQAAVDAASPLRQDFIRGQVDIDDRTNSLVITNTKDSIERIRRLIKELDVPVPQILIDSKIVIASENFTRNMGVSWSTGVFSTSGVAGVSAGSNGVTPPQFVAPPSVGVASGATGNTVSPFAVSAPAGGGAMGISLGATSAANIQAALTLAEIDSLTKTIASPRVIVNNNKPATITDGSTIVIAPPASALGTQATPTTVNANLNLSVTPQVTSMGSVQLKDLNITKNDLGPLTGTSVSTTNKSLTTNVLVDSGSTLVLGGIYQMGSVRGEQGIPLLKDLPFIGQLFRSNSRADNKSELMVFITPQIIDPLSSSQSL